MQKHNFDKILDFLCSGIMSKSERESVRDELYDHLMCKYETNLACGMDEEKATEEAINDLGDASMLKFKLSAVHGYAPKPSMKKAMNLLIAGFVLMSFHISLLEGMADITKFIGTVIFLVALFCLSKSNIKLKKAFFVCYVSFVLTHLVDAMAAEWFDGFNINVPLGIINSILSVVFWVYMVGGLYELVKPFESIKSLKRPLEICRVVNIILVIPQLVLYLEYFVDNDYWIENSQIAWILIPIALISIIVTLVAFVGVSKLLWNSDHEYKIETSSSKKAVAALIAVAIAVIPTVSVDVYLSTQKAETTVHTIDDSNISQAEYDRICSNLLSYGIPEDIVYNLPESEIEKYADSINFSEFDESAQRYYGLNGEKTFETANGTQVEYNSYAVTLNSHEVRVISWMKYLCGSVGYSDGLFWECAMMPVSSDEEYNGDFLLILSEEHGVTLRNEPLDVYTDENGLTNKMTGVRFQAKDELIVIHAETLSVGNFANECADYLLESYIRKMPLSFNNRTPLEIYGKSKFETLEYVRSQGRGSLLCVVPEEESESEINTEEIYA